MASDDRYYLGKDETPLNNVQAKETLVQRLRQYLDLRNVSLLIGNGASLPFGAPTISDVAKIEKELHNNEFKLQEQTSQKRAIALLNQILSAISGQLDLEPVLGLLSHIQSDLSILGDKATLVLNGHRIQTEEAELLESLLKKWLYIKCHEVSTTTTEEDLRYHRELFRRFLLRSTSLPRLKLFTTNYDLLIERALDHLSIAYFDGFLGTTRRSLRSESYHYDLYYPGDTTEGRVSRVDRVLQLFKLHGSINWRRDTSGSYLDVIVDHQQPNDAEYGNVMVYPSPIKTTEMHGYPYSEMFRHFATEIQQPQSVLFTVGYSFRDEHINRIIYQALSIPSFELVIVIPDVGEPKKKDGQGTMGEIWRLINKVESKRILVITGGEFVNGKGYVSGSGTLQGFAVELMPDIKEMAIESKVREEAAKALGIGVPSKGVDQ